MKAHCSSLSGFEKDSYDRWIWFPPSLQIFCLLSGMFSDFTGRHQEALPAHNDNRDHLRCFSLQKHVFIKKKKLTYLKNNNLKNYCNPSIKF